LYPEMVAVADTSVELARQMKVNAEGLTATIHRYNGFVAEGRDKDFGKPVLGHGTAKPPYFAVRMALVKHTRRNGIRVNTRGQVLDCAGLLPAGAFEEHGDVGPAGNHTRLLRGWRMCELPWPFAWTRHTGNLFILRTHCGTERGTCCYAQLIVGEGDAKGRT
jgi:hypothetical protein